MAFVLLAAACSGSDAAPTTVGSDPVTTVDGTDPGTTDPGATGPGGTDPDTGGPVGFAPAALRQFDECSAFLDYVHTEGAERVGPYGFDGGGFYGPVVFEADTVAEEAASEPSDGAGDAAPATDAVERTQGSGDEGSFSTTNVQVDGVDEPDIVKTDGDRVIAITDNTLHYIDIDPSGATGVKRGSVLLNDTNNYSYGHEIFVAGDRAFVFAQGDGFLYGVPEPRPVEPTTAEETLVDDAEADFAPPIDDPITSPTFFGPSTVILEIDLSDPDSPSIANTMTVEGRYISARAIGETVRLVVTSPPQDLGFLYPSNPGTEDRAEEVNQQIVRESTVEDWIPNYTLVRSDGTTSTGQLVECNGIHAPSDFSGFDMLSIVTLDLGTDLAGPTGTSTVMATGDTVYASQDRMYVSTNVWTPVIDEQTREWLDENYQTAIHRFSIAGDGPAAYQASGSVDGHLLNQFAMNDRDGVFYVATTTGAPWTESSESQIVAMEVDGDRLVQVGSVGGLGLGERIFSVRYVADTAYVVTFRQVDPFYVVNIADPRAMSVEGELKIPGFSSYLHPIGDDLVLGVGQDATDEGRTTGTKVSLFDVSDPADPVEVDVWTLPNAYSDAEFDHRAFLWWEPTRTAVLPLQSWSDQFAGAVVLTVGTDGIVEQGRITHADDADGPVGQTDCRVLTADEVPDDTNELFWIVREGGQVNLCGPNDQGGATGLFCETIPIDDFRFWIGDEQVDIDLGDADRFELCWPDWNGYQIGVLRTMVIDDTLWTLSLDRLQGNDLATLDRTDAIDL